MEELYDSGSKQNGGPHRKRKNLLIGIIVVLLLAVSLFFLIENTLFGKENSSSESQEVIAANVQTLQELEQKDVPDVAALNSERAQAAAEENTPAEETIEETATGEDVPEEGSTEESDAGENAVEETEENSGGSAVVVIDQATEQQKIMTMENPDMSTLLEWFQGSAIVGDSIVAGLSSAQFLNSSIVFGEVGISVYGSDDLIARMEAVYPQNVFLCFGLNDMSHYGENVEKLIENYRPRIEKIRADLPTANIYLVGVTPVQEQAIASNSKMAYESLYNQRLETFAAEMGVGFIDPSFILEQDPSYFGSDGMHPNGSFYYKWLTYLADMAGLSS